MPISNSRKNNRISEADFASFEKELLVVLKNDRDHHIGFDGKLMFHSTRYGCDLEAADVHWDPKRGDLVLVGACRNGAVIDESKGFPQILNCVEIPFREVYEEMRDGQHNELYLVSKTKKSVLDKYILKPLEKLENLGVIDVGSVIFKDFGLKDVRLGGSSVTGIHKNPEGKVVFTSDGAPERPAAFGNSITDIQSLGRNFSGIFETYEAAMNDFIEAKRSIVGTNQSATDYDVMHANSEGMATLYEKGYSARICNAVSRRVADSSFFDLSKNDVKAISKAVRDYREKNIFIQRNVSRQESRLVGPRL